MATIESIEVHDFSYEVANLQVDDHLNLVPVKGGRATLSKFGIVIRDSDGAVGEYFGAENQAVRAHAIQAIPLVLGRDVDEREKIFDDCKRVLRHIGGFGVSPLDCALWDLAGKRTGLSVSAMLGRFRTTLPAYASTFHGSRTGALATKEAYADYAEACYELGYRAFKIHGWSETDRQEEAANVLHMGRAMAGKMRALMLDPACELRTFADALYVGRACDDAGFFWFEDPFRDGGLALEAHRKLRALIKTPLLMTEHVHPMELKVPFILGGGTDFVRANPNYDLGITGVMKIAHMAEALGLDVELHGAGPAQRQCMAAIRNTNYYEVTLVAPDVTDMMHPVYGDSYSDNVEAVSADGTFPVPDGPGLGVIVDTDFLESHRTNVATYQS